MYKPKRSLLPFMSFYYNAEQRGIQMTIVGEPSLPMRPEFLTGMQEYLDQQQKAITVARAHLKNKDFDKVAEFKDEHNMRAVEGYGDPQGEKRYRERIAITLNKLYKLSSHTGYKADEILFTAGATGSLSALTQHITRDALVILPFPCHMWHHSPKMFPMDVSQHGFTAEKLDETIKEARNQHGNIHEIRLCDPHNPMGYATSREVWEKVAIILRRPENKNISITLDEAYAEVAFNGHVSLIEVAPDLKDRITIIRTIGKGFSATGYRVGIVAASKKRIQEIMDPNIHIYFKVAPEIQAGYTKVMEWYENHQQEHHQDMRDFYQSQVQKITERTEELGIAYPKKNHHPQIFYVLMDLSEFKGLSLTSKTKEILGTYNTSGVVETDVDVAAYLLAEKNIALFPLSYFYHDPDACVLRITCGQGMNLLNKVMDSVESVLQNIRQSNHSKKIISA
ncbi:MAG: pyridoxal phosphate-dependent aminotransferase [Alphaproteobacteria bacterium]|nr:pyridoxal phosphate-dependent aminotransferase [Alphaproteobacteria bacterium]